MYATEIETEIIYVHMCDRKMIEDTSAIKAKRNSGRKMSDEIETGVFISATKVTKICFRNKKRSILEAFFFYVYS